MVGTGCIAAACLISPRLLIGLLGSTGFVVLSGLTALFHGRRLLVAVWTVAVATLCVLAVRLAATGSTVVAVWGVILVAVVMLFATFVSLALLGLIDPEPVTGAIEPSTGLLNRVGFDDGVATMIAARGRQDDRYLVVAVINIDSLAIAFAMSHAANGDRARVAIGQRLRETVRRDAVLAHVDDAEFLVADVFTEPDPTPLIERIRDGVHSVAPQVTASIGSASTALAPLAAYSPHDVSEELLACATAAMYDARRQGGNQYCRVHLPHLTLPDASGAASAD